jgi:hypothetical protein
MTEYKPSLLLKHKIKNGWQKKEIADTYNSDYKKSINGKLSNILI